MSFSPWCLAALGWGSYILTTALLLAFVSFWETLLFLSAVLKQHIVSRSSTEVEYRALADTTFELLALH